MDNMLLFAVVGFGACSSLMLIVNKLVVHLFPAPSFILLAQCVSTFVAVKTLGLCGVIEVDDLECGKARSFFLVAAISLLCLLTNIKTLQYCNVETFIAFRCSTSLVVCVCEWLCLGRELPSPRSVAAIVCMLSGTAAYAATDAAFVVRGYVWAGTWYVAFCFNQLYIKHIVDTTVMKSNWGRVYYTNLLSSVLLCLITPLTDMDALTHVVQSSDLDAAAAAALVGSCILGTGISYFAFLCRSMVSATSFNIIGDVCRAASDKRAPLFSAARLMPRLDAALDSGTARPCLHDFTWTCPICHAQARSSPSS